MSEIGIVFTTELMRKIRTRIFIVATALGVIGIVFLLQAPLLFEHFEGPSSDALIVAGPPALRARADALLEQNNAFRLVGDVDRLPARVTPAYLNARHAAAAIDLSVRNRRLHVDVFPREASAFNEVRFRALAPLAVEIATGIPAGRVASSMAVDRTIHPVGGKSSDGPSAAFAYGLAFGLIFILYFAIIISSQSVLAAVAEEKTSRIAEILVATISPSNLLAGKIFATAVLALAQVTVWVATIIIFLPSSLLELGVSSGASPSALGASSSAILGGGAPVFDPKLLLAFGVFFILGYLQFATAYAAAASLISRTEDLGSVTTPIVLPVIAAFFVAQWTIAHPSSRLSIAAGFVPFLSPFAFFARMAVSNVPAWEFALAVGINLATVVFAFWIAGRIYRVGMLLYGKLPTLRQVWSAVRT
jgi:ABC-2 type transport system permease protein